MKKNVGKIDKIIRLVIAIILIILISASVITGLYAIIAGIISFAMIITSLTGFCGLYSILGIKTCPLDKSKKE